VNIYNDVAHWSYGGTEGFRSEIHHRTLNDAMAGGGAWLEEDDQVGRRSLGKEKRWCNGLDEKKKKNQ
jgi:hypothetical protein